MNKQKLITSQSLLSIGEIAKLEKVSDVTIFNEIKALNIFPVIKGRSLGKGKGKSPDLYNYESFCTLRENEQENKRAKKQDSKLQTAVNNTKPEVKQRIMKDYVQQLSDDDSIESAEEVLANAAGFVSMLFKKMETFKKLAEDQKVEIATQKTEIDRLESELENVNVKLDLSASYHSVKKMEKQMQQKYDWRKLKAWAIDHQKKYAYPLMGKIPDSNYGEVNTYHDKVWQVVYPKCKV